jgi:hypothetical protein
MRPESGPDLVAAVAKSPFSSRVEMFDKPSAYLQIYLSLGLFNEGGHMSSTKNPGRFAGLLYLLTSIVGFFAMGYVPNKLIVHGNAAATASNITASETLFRLGIAGELIGMVGFVFLAICMVADLLSPKYSGVFGSFPSRCLCTGRDSCRDSSACGSPSPASPG